jgi:hypothetical protein
MGGETKEKRKYKGGKKKKNQREKDQTNLGNHLTNHSITKTVIILATSSHHNNSSIMKLALR